MLEPRSVGATLFYEGLHALGLAAARRRWCDAAVVLCYHNVIGDTDVVMGAPGLHIPCARFARQVRWLADHYTIVSLGEFVHRRGTRSWPPLAAITFDDAYTGVFDHAAPLLERLGLPCTVFVVAEAAGGSSGFWWDDPGVVSAQTDARREQWLRSLRGDRASIMADVRATGTPLPPAYRAADWATIRARAEGGRLDVGVHSATHRHLPSLTDAELEHEVMASRRLIHREIAVWPQFFAYPYGLCDERVRAAVRSAGYRAAFGLDPALQGAAGDRWMLPRVNIPSGLSHRAFEAWTAGLH
jgi:peptidoglycan/xylan/chitin deacetylase (PgdA/CDA1 family)